MKRTIKLLDSLDKVHTVDVEVNVGSVTTLTLSNGILVRGNDVFSALQELRGQLGCRGWNALCQGSRRNVYPSRALRQSGTTKAYKLTLGRPTTREDLVELFDPCEKEEVSTVEEQEAFNVEWLSSLNKH